MSEILKLHNMLCSKEISAKELTQKYLSAIKSLNPDLNAYIKISEDEALISADIIDRKIAGSEDIDLLSGIPMTLKDNISTKGNDTTCCSKILEGYKPIYDATAWQRLKSKGAVHLGKTNMDEFAMGCTTETSVYGSSKNPYNKNFVAGGSSGGTASAVSANLAVYGIGSDTGGSVRQPASFCGCVGLKPTYGAVSRYGLIAYASSLDTVGVLAGNVADTAVVFDRIAGFDPMDSTSRPDFSPCAFDFLDKDIKGRKIGVPQELIDRADEDVKYQVLKAIKIFEDMGCVVEFFSMPSLITALPAYYIIACAEASSNLGRYDGVRYGLKAECFESIHQMICKTRSENFGDEVKKRIMLGTFVLSEGYYDKYYAKAQHLRQELKAQFKKVFERYDALVTPTSPKTAFRLCEVEENKEGSFNADLCTVSANLGGLPAVSLPCGKDSRGLPVGLQIIGDKFMENRILNLAKKFEESRGEFGLKDMGVRFDV
ncbi:MAG: Asp-tRNA(Asn)/Glu-tRNA(Gln) amidotransferase subunit GatA [Clostridia bacterium]|nr:Asp-tRNA(Asn)/Glu-tRNA(Gln) amidotransferase subunit GatA [Clostridia bacterium]